MTHRTAAAAAGGAQPDQAGLTPQQMRERAEAWYGRQVNTLRQCHGAQWPQHQAWIEEYLQTQIRQRLIETGWRPRR